LKGILFPTLSLFLICFVMTGALAVVNAVTKGPIAANEKLAADLAREELFPGARFVDNGAYFTAMEQNGTPIGYCIKSQARGYGGVIQVAVGLDLQGSVLKVQIIACDGETPGLGQKIRDEGFLAQFSGPANYFFIREAVASYFGDTKPIDAIASATYSSQGVVEAVNMALEIYREVIAQ